MGKLLKFLVITIGVLILILGAAIVIIPMVIDANDYKDEITAKVQEATGRTLNINGPLDISVFPWVALKVTDATLSNAKGFSERPMLTLAEADIRVKLIPLIADKRLEMDTVVLRSLHLNLEKDKQGKTNLDDLGSQGDNTESDTSKIPSSKDDEAKPGLEALAIDGIQISNASLSYSDAQSGNNYKISALNLSSGAIAAGATVPLEASLHVEDGHDLALDIQSEASLKLDQDQQRLFLSGLSLKVDGKAGAPQPIDLRLNGDIDYGLSDASLNAKAVELSIFGIQLRATLAATDVNADNARFKGQLALSPLDLRTLLEKLNGEAPKTTDPEVLKQVSLKADFDAGKTQAKLSSVDLSLDDSKLRGHINIRNFQGPGIDFKLDVDEINVDRYLPPASKQATTNASDKQTAKDQAAAELPLEALRKLDMNGEFGIGRLTVNKLHVQNAKLKLKAKGGLIQVNPFTADLYEGTINKTASLDVRKNTPRYHAKLKLNDVQIEPLLTDMNGESPISGRTQISADVRSLGQGDAITQNLSGTARFKFLDGAYNGVNVAYEIRRARAILKGQTAPEKTSNSTDFALMSGSAKINKGVLNNQDLLVQAPLLRITGKGTANLAKQTTDYRLTAAVVNTTKGQGGADLADLHGLKIPVKIKGPFSSPDIGVDLQKLLSSQAKQKAKDAVKKQLEKSLGDKIPGLGGGNGGGGGGGLGDALKGLF